MNWDWPSYWIGFATPFVIVAIVAVMVFVVSFAFEHPCGSECLPCDRTISENDCRIIRRVKELAHNLTPVHRRNHARWLREVLAGRPCPTPVFLDDRGSVAATFDGRHPVRIDGREVVRVFGNDVFLLDGMLVRLPGWWRDGDRLVVPDAAACGMIRAGERGTVYPYMGVSVAVDGPDDGTIRIPMPSCRPWRGERARRKWIRETEDSSARNWTTRYRRKPCQTTCWTDTRPCSPNRNGHDSARTWTNSSAAHSHATTRIRRCIWHG